MIAKQTTTSASLVVLLVGAAVTAHADPPEPACDRPPGEAAAISGSACKPPPPAREPTGTFQIGAGFSTDDNFIAMARVAQDDLFGTGNHLSLTAKLSAREQMSVVRFVDPDVLGSDLALGADIHNRRVLLPNDVVRDSAGASLAVSHPLGDRLRGFVGYRVETVSIADERPLLARAAAAPAPGDRYLISALRAGLAYADVDRPDLPTRGTTAGASIEVADGRLGSDVAMTRLDAWASHHRPLGPFTLHLGGRASAVLGGALPITELLHLDGSSDVRGFAPGAFGPRDGGRYKLSGRAELELPVIPTLGIGVVGFVDGGTIADELGRAATGYAAGFGVIWRSPIGPLRFDWAFPFGDGPPRFVFGIGSQF